jgi:hypothetical protein
VECSSLTVAMPYNPGDKKRLLSTEARVRGSIYSCEDLRERSDILQVFI